MVTKANKIDSNVTGLRFAEETSIGVLPETGVVWYPLEPNSYADFGGQPTLLARNPINASRQRKKGSITDLDASGGINQDLTQENLQRMLQGFMFASYRSKAEQAVSAAVADTATVADGTAFAVGDIVKGKGFLDGAANEPLYVSAVAGNDLTIVGFPAMADTSGGTLVRVGVQTTEGDIAVDVSGTLPALTSTALDFTTLGLVPGEWIFIGGDDADTFFAEDANNGFKRVRSIEANRLVIDKSDIAMVDEPGGTANVEIYLGRALKNEVGSLIKRRSYHIERELGAPDLDAPTQVQAEYLVGAIANTLTFNIAQANKVNCDLGFIAIDNEQREAHEGQKAGSRPPLIEADMFNTSSDFTGLRIAINDDTSESVTPLFAFVEEMTLTIDNGATPNKAVAVLGAFDVSVGTFTVNGEITAYFSDIAATKAVRDNADVSMYGWLAKQNAGLVFDVPLIGLGNGRPNVTQNEAIKLPLSMDAATAAKLDPSLDYTLMFVFFDYLPTAAE